MHVTVADPAGSYRSGLGAALVSAGFIVDEPEDVHAWVARFPADAVLFTVRSANDWADLRDLLQVNPLVGGGIAGRRHPRPSRRGPSPRSSRRRRLGRAAGTHRVHRPERALAGDTLLPTEVAVAIATSSPPLHDPEWISAEETEWLRYLASGATIQQLGERIGYSERALYRVLHGLTAACGCQIEPRQFCKPASGD